MEAFDNFQIADLYLLLNRDTTPQRYYPLTAARERLIQGLLAAGISDKQTYLSVSDAEHIRRHDIDADTAALFRRFLLLHDHKPIRLANISGIDPALVERLHADGIKTSSEYLSLCMHGGAAAAAARCGADPAAARKLFCLCDLMRLPGVKDIRANLYYACGLKTSAAFVGQNAERLQACIARHIAEHGLPQSVPLPKELRTQIAVAAILPRIAG